MRAACSVIKRRESAARRLRKVRQRRRWCGAEGQNMKSGDPVWSPDKTIVSYNLKPNESGLRYGISPITKNTVPIIARKISATLILR